MWSKADTDKFLHLDASKEQLSFEFYRLSIGSITGRALWIAKGERFGVAYSAREHRSWSERKREKDEYMAAGKCVGELKMFQVLLFPDVKAIYSLQN